MPVFIWIETGVFPEAQRLHPSAACTRSVQITLANAIEAPGKILQYQSGRRMPNIADDQEQKDVAAQPGSWSRGSGRG